MVTITSAITINPAFLQEIKEDNKELRRLLAEARVVFSDDRWRDTQAARLVEMMVRLRDQLALHFRLEEAYGYFDDSVAGAPHLDGEAARLRAQHADLYRAMCALVDDAGKSNAPGAGSETTDLASRFREFDAGFRNHELCEVELITQAANEDLGVGD